MNNSYFKPTITINFSRIESENLKIGQWFKLPSGARGQYLGKTHAGPVVNWVNERFTKVHAYANGALRTYATLNGSK